MRWALLMLLALGCTKEGAPEKDAGAFPRIEDLRVDDLSSFVGGKTWCREGAQFAFREDGTWTRTEGGTTTAGTWTAQKDRLTLQSDAGARPLFVEAGKVDGRVVASLDGRLYSECP